MKQQVLLKKAITHNKDEYYPIAKSSFEKSKEHFEKIGWQLVRSDEELNWYFEQKGVERPSYFKTPSLSDPRPKAKTTKENNKSKTNEDKK